jgi:DnaJ-class molecular chaperone
MIAGPARIATIYRALVAEPPTENASPLPCDACRGSGVVISHLGGEPHEEPCPWCDGGGMRLSAHDAQARWRADAT